MNEVRRAMVRDGERFGIGQSVTRKEDPVLLRGEGRYTDDLMADGQVYLAFVRSPLAHGVITGIDADAAREMEGVLGVWTAADLDYCRTSESMVKFHNRDGSLYHQTRRLPLAVDRVRYVGEPVVCVAAETAMLAKDAAEAVSVDINPLPAVTSVAAAIAPDAPLLHDEVPNNTVVDFFHGDVDATKAAFAEATHVVRLSLEDSRVIINPMELRCCLALYDAERAHFTLHTPCQGVFGLRNEIAGIMDLEHKDLTVLTGHVGGSFGMRILAFPEQICALHAARALGRPVKWTEERTTSFLSDNHGRATRFDAELALDAEGRFLGVRIEGFGDMGAYLTIVGMMPATRNILINTCSMYRLPTIQVATRCVLTNTSPVGAYRGAGRQAGNYIMERLIDEAARISGIDRLELRRRNQVAPDELPYAAQSGLTYDCGDFTAMMDHALEAADVAGFAERQAASRKAGKLRGLGVGCYLEATAAVTREMGGIRFGEDGSVTIVTGTLDYGQGHASSLAQVLVSQLGVPFESVRLLQGDSDELLHGGGTGGSRSMIASGSALVAASQQVIEKCMALAGWALETTANDIVYEDGALKVVSTGQSMAILELARRVREARSLPEGLPKSLDVELVNDGPPITYPNGCHVAEVEIEEATGVAQVVKYTMVNDIGVVINPLLLEGQCHGGVVQGIGQALMERVVYDAEGQLLSGSFTDYCMPRAEDVPYFEVLHRPQPTESNPLGVKGVGESGCAGSLTSVMNAVVDALSQVGVHHIDMPATPEKVWRAIHGARRAA